MQDHVAALRAAYMAEIARFAETLRPRFQAGELRGFATGDDDHGHDSPCWELERLVRQRFGLEVDQTTWSGDCTMACAVLSVSPHAESTEDRGWNHVCYQASHAATWDVLARARALGWYVPGAEEESDPNEEVLS